MRKRENTNIPTTDTIIIKGEYSKMSDFISYIRRIPIKLLKKNTISGSSPIAIKRARVLNEKSSFHVKEAYKALRTNIVFSLPHNKAKKVLVTSALAGEGKSTNCLNIAISFAQTGAKVLLIDCDLRKPNVANLLNIPSSPGLSNILANLNTVESTIIHSDHSNLDVIPSGDMPPNPSELLGSAVMKDTLEKLSETYEYIFLDSTPINIVTDAAVMTKMIDGVVFVVRQGRTDKDTVAEAIKKLEIVDAKILGFVLNGRLTDNKTTYKYSKKGYYRYGSKKAPYYKSKYYGTSYSNSYSSGGYYKQSQPTSKTAGSKKRKSR